MGTGDGAGPFGLGCVNLGRGGRKDVWLVHRALDLGVQVFDTADAYGGGGSERVLGRSLRGRRDGVFVATKGGYLFRDRRPLESAVRRAVRPALQRARWSSARTSRLSASAAGGRAYAGQDFSAAYLRTALEGSLRRLGTDYVDLYQLHGPRDVCHDDVLGLMRDLRSEGKIRGFGVGLETLDQAMEWLATGALSSVQIPFGVLDPEAGEQVIPWARAHGIAVVARGVFAGGCLVERPGRGDEVLRPGQSELRSAVRALATAAGVGVLQIAAWFVTTHPGVTTVLVGTSSGPHLEQSLRYITAPVPRKVMPLLDGLAAKEDRALPVKPSPRDAGTR